MCPLMHPYLALLLSSKSNCAQWVRLLAFARSGHLWAIPPGPVASRQGQKT